MGAKIHVVSHFGKDYGRLVTDSGAAVAIGHSAESFAPYELILGGLSNCLFWTFESVIEKMKVTYNNLDMDIDGVKRDEKVATLETCHIRVTVKGASDQEKIEKAFDIATRYCSVFYTISHVAKMSWEMKFE